VPDELFNLQYGGCLECLALLLTINCCGEIHPLPTAVRPP
jgi:hypothetical protein